MINIDMDGVVADFIAGVKTYQQINKLEHLNWNDVTREAINSTDFYANLLPMPGFNEFKKIYHSSGSVRFLTSIGSTDNFALKQNVDMIKRDKLKWLQTYVNLKSDSDVIFTDNPEQKANFCTTEFDILVDDRYKTIQDWTKKGGISIYYNTRDLLFDDIESIERLAKATTNLIRKFI